MLLNDWSKWNIAIKVVVRRICKVAISYKADEDSPALIIPAKNFHAFFNIKKNGGMFCKYVSQFFPGAHNANQFVGRSSYIQPPPSISFSQYIDFLSF